MAVPPRLPNLPAQDMAWVRWATHELTKVKATQSTLQSNVAAAVRQASSSTALVTTQVEKAAVQNAVTPNVPKGAPEIPTTPMLATDHGTVTVRWDGLVHGNLSYAPAAGEDAKGSAREPAIGFAHINVWRAASDGAWVLIGGTMGREGTVVDTNVVVGQTYSYRFVTQDTLNAVSAPSDSASIVVKGVDLGTLDQDVKDALKAASDAAQAGLDAGKAGQDAAAAAQAAAGTADAKAAQALQDAAAAQQKATDAMTAAENATGTNSVVFSNTAPTGDANVLWINTTNNANTPNHWNGSAWVVITDKAAVDAAAAAAAANTAAGNAQTTANTAVTNAQTAQTTANNALTAANGKNKVYYQTGQPSNTGNTTGDIWFDTDDGYKLYVWNGSAWTASVLGASALGANSVTATQLKSGEIDATKLANTVNTSISTAQTTANTAVTNAANAKTAADNAAAAAAGKTTVVYSTTAPTGDATVLWINTANNANTPNRWTGSAWVVITDKVATDAATAAAAANTAAGNAQTTANNAATAASTAQTAANSKTKVTYSTAAPGAAVGTTTGDLWFVQDATGAITGQYVWSGSTWVSQTLTNAVIATLDAAKITTGTLAAARIGAHTISANEMVVGTITAASGIIADAAITNAKIADAAITNAKISDLDAGKITAGTINSLRIGANSIAASQMIAGTITAASGILADAVVTNAKIADLAVNTAKIADLAVNNAKINDLDGNKIQAATVVAGKLAADSVATNNIIAGSIDTNRLAAGAITADKLSVGAVPQKGSGTNRVPALPNDVAYWSLVTSNKTPGFSYRQATASTTGLLLAAGGAAGTRMSITAQYVPVPTSRKINLAVNYPNGSIFVREYNQANGLIRERNVANGIVTLSADAISYEVFVGNFSTTSLTTLVDAALVFDVIGTSGTQSAEISPSGLRLFDTTGHLAADLTTASKQFLNIYDNSGGDSVAVASIDQTGNAVLNGLDVDFLNINGLQLTDETSPTTLSQSTPNNGDFGGVPLFDRLSRGVIYDVTWPRLDAVVVSTQYRRIAQDQFTLENGRQYQFNVQTGALQIDTNASGVNVYLELQVGTVPNTSITTGQTIQRAVVYKGDNDYFAMPPVVWTASSAVTTIDTVNRLLPAGVPLYWQINFNLSATPTTAYTLHEWGYSRGLTIIDVGSAYLTRPGGNDALASVADNSTSGASSGSTSGGTTATSTTKTWTASWSRTWNNSGSSIVSGTGSYTNGSSMYQGNGVTPMGSKFGFAALGITGKTVTAMSLYLYASYFAYSGKTALLGTHADTAAPATYTGARANAWSPAWSGGSGKWVSVPSNLWAGFAAGTYRGFSLGVDGSDSNYAYFNGATQANPPKIKITYH